MFVWEVPYWPRWFFSRDDIAAELVPAASGASGDALENGERSTFYDLVVGDQVLDSAARGYPDSANDALRDLVAIDFGALDHWFEEDIEVYVHPRRPFTRVDAPRRRRATSSCRSTASPAAHRVRTRGTLTSTRR